MRGPEQEDPDYELKGDPETTLLTDAAMASTEAETARIDAEKARNEAEKARTDAATARAQAEFASAELQALRQHIEGFWPGLQAEIEP